MSLEGNSPYALISSSWLNSCKASKRLRRFCFRFVARAGLWGGVDISEGKSAVWSEAVWIVNKKIYTESAIMAQLLVGTAVKHASGGRRNMRVNHRLFPIMIAPMHSGSNWKFFWRGYKRGEWEDVSCMWSRRQPELLTIQFEREKLWIGGLRLHNLSVFAARVQVSMSSCWITVNNVV